MSIIICLYTNESFRKNKTGTIDKQQHNQRAPFSSFPTPKKGDKKCPNIYVMHLLFNRKSNRQSLTFSFY